MGHGEVLDVGYTSPIAGLQSRTVNAKLFLPTLRRAPASFTLEGIADTVRGSPFASAASCVLFFVSCILFGLLFVGLVGSLAVVFRCRVFCLLLLFFVG